MLLAVALVLAAHRPIICIDPGHPSEVGRGTRGKKITELAFVWKLAKRMEDLLEKEGAVVVLTKSSEEQFVRNADRARIANEAKADLLLRLHCDAAKGRGMTLYAPTRRGKAASGKTGPSDQVLQSSQAAQKAMQDSLLESLKGVFPVNPRKTDLQTAVGAKQGALTGSIYSQVPVVLVEVCVLTNPTDEAFVATEKGFETLAQALSKAALSAAKRSVMSPAVP